MRRRYYYVLVPGAAVIGGSWLIPGGTAPHVLATVFLALFGAVGIAILKVL